MAAESGLCFLYTPICYLRIIQGPTHGSFFRLWSLVLWNDNNRNSKRKRCSTVAETVVFFLIWLTAMTQNSCFFTTSSRLCGDTERTSGCVSTPWNHCKVWLHTQLLPSEEGSGLGANTGLPPTFSLNFDRLVWIDFWFFTLLKPVPPSPYLTEKGDGISEISLTNGADVPRLAALLTAGPHSITLDEEKKTREWQLRG